MRVALRTFDLICTVRNSVITSRASWLYAFLPIRIDPNSCSFNRLISDVAFSAFFNDLSLSRRLVTMDEIHRASQGIKGS